MNSLWQECSSVSNFPQLDGNIKTDVLIIGGGLAGMLLAYELHHRGVKYALVERDTICSKTTGNTTAKITYQHGLVYHKLVSSYSAEVGKKYLRANQLAFDRYERLCTDIDCHYEHRDNYVYSISDRAKLEKEMQALDKIGYNASFVNSLELPFSTAGAVKFPNQAQFNPLEFVSHISKGLNIYENTTVLQMVGNTAITNRGKISADTVVVATHFPFINKHGSYFIKLYQHRSYVEAFENAQPINGMYVDDNHKGMSFRSYGDMLLIGGGGHRTGKQGGCWQKIDAFASQHYPNAKLKYRWAAQDTLSLDSIPYIGRYSKSTNNLYVATGFNKWGMTGSMLSSMIISDMLFDKQNDYADIFNPSRSMLTPQLFANGFESAKGLLTLTPKRCPHLGCALKWNSVEHSWDCPCHGSRFDKSGTLLNNPANESI